MIYHTGSSRMRYVIRLRIITTAKERIPEQIEQAKYHSPGKTNVINLGFQGRTLRKQYQIIPAQSSPEQVLSYLRTWC